MGRHASLKKRDREMARRKRAEEKRAKKEARRIERSRKINQAQIFALPWAKNEFRYLLCMDCKRSTSTLNEWYMVHDHIWDSVTQWEDGHRFLCIGCLETRL